MAKIKGKKLTNGHILKGLFNDFEHALLGVLGIKLDDKDMPQLENKKQKRQGLKILTPQQMITGLPVLLAHLKAGNNSQKLKNEIRQIVYSLYRSKSLSKTIYNSLMNTI